MGKDATRRPPARDQDAGADPSEIARFGSLAERCWDADGPMRPLHLMNPLRLDYVLRQLSSGRADAGRRSLAGLATLDVGCGAGLACEPLARLGAAVTGIDAAPEMIEVAGAHAAAGGLTVEYVLGTLDLVVAQGRRFDLVTAFEVIEHVPDQHAFVSALGQVTRPGGLVVMSTLSRSLASLVLAIGAGEYLLRLLPRGTHDWRRFVRPAELATRLRDAGLRPVDVCGLAYDPGHQRFRVTRRVGVNYLMAARRG